VTWIKRVAAGAAAPEGLPTLPSHPALHPAAPTVTPLQSLESLPWLADVAPPILAKLAEHAVLHRVPAGVQLFEQAEIPGVVQFLIKGEIELLAVRDGEETLIELVRGPDLLLPAAVLNRQAYLARARVHRDALLMLAPAEAFRHAVRADHAFCLAVLACQAVQFRRQMKLAKAIRLRSAEERLGAYLVGLCAGAASGAEIHLPLEKRQIASQLGMTRETLSRSFPAMARHGLRVAGDVLHVDDLAAARAAFPIDPQIDGAETVTPLKPIKD
jgi:CRP/FNR family transcriptional activator FtrB